MPEKELTEVWGLAAGINSTADAAVGAFTWRRYEKGKVPTKDWKLIMSIEDVTE